MAKHWNGIASSITVVTLGTLLANIMIADIVTLAVKASYIIGCTLYLARLKGYILLVNLATGYDNTIIAVLNGSSSKLMTAYLLRDNNLP